MEERDTSQPNTYGTGTMGRAVTTSARREKETSSVRGIVHDVLHGERGEVFILGSTSGTTSWTPREFGSDLLE